MTIYIISGEGTGEGTRELYTGKMSARAIRQRVTRERCGGDRWARLESEAGERIIDEDLPRIELLTERGMATA